MQPETSRIKTLMFFIVLSLCATNLTTAKAAESYHRQLSKGIAELKKNNIDRALDFFYESLADKPNGVEGHYYVGVSHARANRTKMAETSFKQALMIDRTFLPAHFDLAVLYYQIGEDSKALESFKTVEQIDPTRARVYYYQGIILRRRGNRQAGAEKLKKAVALNPKLEVETRFQEGVFHYKSGDFNAARDAFESVVTLSPDGDIGQTSEALLDQIKSLPGNKKPWRLNTSIGLQYDDNVILEPEGNSASAAGIKKKSDLVGLVFLSVNYRLPTKNRWLGDIAYSFFQNFHEENDLNDFKIQDHHITLSGTRSIGRKTQVFLKYDLEFASLGGKTFLFRNALGSQLKIRHSKKHYSELEYVFGDSNFKNSTPLFLNNDDRDVSTHDLRFTHYTFLQDNQFFYSEYAFEKEKAGSSATQDDWSFDGIRFKAGLVYPVRQSIVLSAEGYIRLRHFDNINQRSSGKREDSSKVVILMASKALRKNIDLALQYLHYRNDSNIPIFEYQRNVTGLIMTANF